MIQKLLFVFCFIALSAGLATAQRTVTNADLEGYRQARLKAEREYRDNHERLGMPSPEELSRRNDESLRQTMDMADRLRQQRLEAERLDLERLRSIQIVTLPVPEFSNYAQYPSGIYYSTGIGFANRRPHRFRPINRNASRGYFAGGQFWSTGPRTVSRPIVRTTRRR